jgi:tRNA U34 5-methylaminomethyl-2-thiouridine-forming methyltransferase MnmC
MKRKVVLTSDGSSSLFVETLNEHFHSHFGALQESKHIFIGAGFNSPELLHIDHISIFEMGLGTGLNALLTYCRAQELKKKVFYETVELHPITQEEFLQLNYAQFLKEKDATEVFTNIHSYEWNTPQALSSNFILQKHEISILDFSFPVEKYNLIYFDAFSPDSQPELWTKSLFEKIYNSLLSNGILVTYSTKRIVKTCLQEVGFEVKKLPGPAGKREILYARKINYF